MDDVANIIYCAVELSILMDQDPRHHITRIQDGHGYPTREEIIEAKKELDKAFEKWLNQ